MDARLIVSKFPFISQCLTLFFIGLPSLSNQIRRQDFIMREPIFDAIESVEDQLAANMEQLFGIQLATAETVLATRGDYLVSLACASLFFPELTVSDGLPMARFATSDREQPLDCFHVDLLHHTTAAGRSPEVYEALGNSLATAWTYALQRQGLAGRFAYNSSSGFDVVYEP